MRCHRILPGFTLALLWVSGGVVAAEFHVTPDGSTSAVGSIADPWDLQTALAHPDVVQPGDVIWLHEGTYRGSFFSELEGTAGHPIIVRQAPGERAIIDIEPDRRGVGFHGYGAWTRFHGFEITCSNPVRETEQSGSWPNDIRRGSVESRGDHLQWVNLLVHDLGNGFGFWSGGEAGEIYGCLIYNNGWSGPDRGHGHAIYAQNETGTKRIVDNITFQQFGDGIDVYGSTRATIRGFHIEGNVSFLNGALHEPGARTTDLRVGGECPIEDVLITGNLVHGGGIVVGYLWGETNHSARVVNNYMTGGASAYFQSEFVFSGNTVVSEGPLVRLTIADGGSMEGFSISDNTYHLMSKRFGTFAITEGRGRSIPVEDWLARGFDTESEIVEGRPAGIRVFVRPNQFEPGRAHVAVCNWDHNEAVEVDLSDVLKPGMTYRIVDARNVHGQSVVQGTYDGDSVVIPLAPTPPVPPVGMNDYPLPETLPDFAVFVVLPD